MAVCCGTCEIRQFGECPKDGNDGEVNCFQNVNTYMRRLERYNVCRWRQLLRRQPMLHPSYCQGNQNRRICSDGHSGFTWVERESRAHLYTSNARLNLCRKCRAFSHEGSSPQVFPLRTGPKSSWHEGVLTAMRVSLASLANKSNHFFSGHEQGRELASVSTWNVGSMRETLT